MSPEERRRLDRESAAKHFWSLASVADLITRIANALSNELSQPFKPYSHKPKEIEGESAPSSSPDGMPDSDHQSD